MKLKVMLALLALALCAALVGCAGTEQVKLNPKKPVTITLWHYYNGLQKIAFDQMVSEFNETEGLERGIVVEASNQGNVNQLIENVLASAENKVGTEPIPNLFTGYADTVYQVDRMGLVAGLDDYFTDKELDVFVPAYLDEGRLGADGQLKILPTAKSTEILFLNKTDWDKFSVETGASVDALATYEGIVQTAAEYYHWTDAQTPETDNDGKAFFGRDAMANYMIIGCRQLGQKIFDVQDGQVSFQLDDGALRRLWDNYYTPFVSGYFAANGQFRSEDMKVGDLIALVGSSSSASYFPQEVVLGDEEAYPVEALVLPPPVFAGAEKVAVQQGAGMAMTKATPEQMYASSIFMKWFTESSRNIGFSIYSGYLPVRSEDNDMVKLDEAMKRAGATEMSGLLHQSLAVSVQTAGSYTLYTNNAFENGTEARTVLEHSLADRAVRDRALVVEMLGSGLSLEEAVAQVDTDEAFQAWTTELRQLLNDTQKGK